MFPRRKRLNRAAFPNVLSSGRRLSSAHFTAVIAKNSEGYAVVVSKKAARLSVTRHRIKRRALEALKPLPLPPSLILFPKASAAELSSKEMRSELTVLLSKIGK